MKKTFSIIALLVICANVQAQLTKKTIILGGALNAYSAESHYENSPYANGYRNSNISFEPYAGYFISDKSVAGVRLAFGRLTDKYEYATYTYKTYQNFFSVGLFHRQYFSVTEKAAFFLHSAASFGGGKQDIFNSSTDEHSTSKSKSISVSAGPGLNYFINTKWGIEARFGSLYYYNGKTDSGNDSPYSDGTNNGFGLNVSLNNFYAGLQYFISR